MSLKPMKVSDEKKLAEIMERRQKKIQNLHLLPPYTYIVSEGTKTEPYYISALADAINAKYQRLSSGKVVLVKGTGRNTKGLLEYARKQVEKEMPQAQVVWLMYDRDDFPCDDFDNTQFSAENRRDKRSYRVAWSNECIELWFLLHFQDLNANIGREKYREILEEKCSYQKNLKTIYNLLEDQMDIAIRRAKRQYQSYDGAPPSKCCPATRVYELVEELRQYL